MINREWRSHASFRFTFFCSSFIVRTFYRNIWKTAYFVVIVSMLVDIEHLLADPIYIPNRCSIGFHPLHQIWFVALYVVLCLVRWSRFVCSYSLRCYRLSNNQWGMDKLSRIAYIYLQRTSNGKNTVGCFHSVQHFSQLYYSA